jgi:hypothetical protein
MSRVAASLAALGLTVSLHGEPAAQTEPMAKKIARAAESGPAEREALARFKQEIAAYAELHAAEAARLGAKPETAAAQKALAQSIAARRADARQGALLRPEAQGLFRRLIADQLKGPEGLDARKAVVDGNPRAQDEPSPFAPRVNAPYPTGAPRSTVPPSVLVALPALPKCLEYRFVGRDLILVDSVAQLIVDFLPAAAPELPVK